MLFHLVNSFEKLQKSNQIITHKKKQLKSNKLKCFVMLVRIYIYCK